MTAIPYGTIATAMRHATTADACAPIAAPAQHTTTAIPYPTAASARPHQPTPHAPPHRTPPPVTHPKGTPCR
jgi:hypothetical protein